MPYSFIIQPCLHRRGVQNALVECIVQIKEYTNTCAAAEAFSEVLKRLHWHCATAGTFREGLKSLFGSPRRRMLYFQIRSI